MQLPAAKYVIKR